MQLTEADAHGENKQRNNTLKERIERTAGVEKETQTACMGAKKAAYVCKFRGGGGGVVRVSVGCMGNADRVLCRRVHWTHLGDHKQSLV